MILRTLIITIQRSMLNWLIPVVSILCSNSILAIGTNPEIQGEKTGLTDYMDIMITVDTMDYRVLTQKELQQELNKLYKTDRELYHKVKKEFLEPNVFLRVVSVILVIFGAAFLGTLTGCLIYSTEY